MNEEDLVLNNLLGGWYAIKHIQPINISYVP